MKTDSISNSQQIGSTQLNQPNKADKTKQAKKVDLLQQTDESSSKGGVENYGVELSPKARELAEARKKAMKIAKETPDVREDKIAEVKKRIQDGTYQVDSGNIADGMMKEAVREELAEREVR